MLDHCHSIEHESAVRSYACSAPSIWSGFLRLFIAELMIQHFDCSL